MLPRLFQFCIPAFVKKMAIRKLASETAGAFRCEAPKRTGQSHKACLKEYALFTSAQVERLITGNGDIDAVMDSLFEVGCRMGRDVRQRFHVSKPEEAILASRMMYRILEIDMQADGPEGIRISKCFFSQYYSGHACRIMSALDAGMAAGLSGGGTLEFHERMTEGNPCCKARFYMGETR